MTRFAFGRGFALLVDATATGASASLAQQTGSLEGALGTECDESEATSAWLCPAGS